MPARPLDDSRLVSGAPLAAGTRDAGCRMRTRDPAPATRGSPAQVATRRYSLSS
jgi:hypothetical protein